MAHSNLVKILIHDFAGHPFQYELAKELFRRGHTVWFSYFVEDPGPKGDFIALNAGTTSLNIVPISLGYEYRKANFLQRLFADLRYSAIAKKQLSSIGADIVISSNSPAWVQSAFLNLVKTGQCKKFIYWCQDVYSIAVTSFLVKKLGFLGKCIGCGLEWWDKEQMKSADHVVLITHSFLEVTSKWGVPRDRVSVIPNWGAIDKIHVSTGHSHWVSESEIDTDRPVVMYSGTLGLKHNPEMLIGLARTLGEVQVVVVGSGIGFDWLKENHPPNMILMPLQPLEHFSDVLGSASVLVAIIEDEAGMYSVPSKVLSYLCASRPIVLAAPPGNLASEILMRASAGVVVPSNDVNAFTSAVRTLLEDSNLRQALGANGRRFAETEFDILSVCNRFEKLFNDVIDAEAIK